MKKTVIVEATGQASHQKNMWAKCEGLGVLWSGRDLLPKERCLIPSNDFAITIPVIRSHSKHV